MTQFRSVRDLADNFRGSYDGRPAQLSIRVELEAGTTTEFYVLLTFTDDGGSTWISWADASRTLHMNEHTLRDLTLLGEPLLLGRPDVAWPRLFTHTWDTDFLPGSSL